jgi:hypothetical protein
MHSGHYRLVRADVERVFGREPDAEEDATLACRGCGAPCEVDPGTTAHLCAECTGEGKTHEMLDGPQTDEDRAAVQREIARSYVDEEEAWARVLEERAAGKRDMAATEDDAPEETEPAAHSPEAMWRDLAAPTPVGYVPEAGCDDCGNDPGQLHAVTCSRSAEGLKRRAGR